MTRSSADAAETLRVLEALIGFDTTSRNSNLDLIHWVRSYLGEFGVPAHPIFNEDGRKANLHAVIGLRERPGVILSGHTDTVPVDGQAWTSDPFRLTERDGRFYGRGTSDMKSFLAAALAAVPRFRAAELRRPVHLCFSYDEEVGCKGVPSLIDHLGTFAAKPALCVVGEPTGMDVVTGHKGKLSLRCHVRGRACHSSLAPQGVNAVEYAAELVAGIRAIGRRFAVSGPFDASFDLAHTTAHTGRIQGGIALNIVPESCWFDFEFRYLPGEDPQALLAEVRGLADALLPEMRAVAPEAGFAWEPISAFPGLDMPEDDPAVGLVKGFARSNRVFKVAYGTEGGLFQHRGRIASVVCGPGSIAQAHTPDEFIERAQLVAADSFMDRVRAWAAEG